MYTQSIKPFTNAEFEHRIERARALMTERELDAIVVSSEQNFLYFTGFLTQFFVSPSRSWFFVLPRNGEPCAIVPSLGQGPMTETTWVRNYRTWTSPNPDDEGVSLVVSYLSEECKKSFGRVGFEIGPEARMGFPVSDFLKIRDLLGATEIGDCEGLVRLLRNIKSPQEVARHRKICKIVSDGYEAVPKEFVRGDSEWDVATRFINNVYRGGADRIPYLTLNSGKGGYRTACAEASDRVIEPGEIFMIDTGCTLEGYYSDFNRNWALGDVSDEAKIAYELLYDATEAALEIVRPGVRTSELFNIQLKVIEASLSKFKNPMTNLNVAGRFGHGLGLHLTEAPSNSPTDDTVLEPGFVLTIEPGLFFTQTQLMLTEENIVITEDGYDLLSRRAPRELPIISV